jgi:hypothetical protein
MPPDSFCIIQDGQVTVTHPVTLGHDSTLLFANDLTITGTLTLANHSWLGSISSSADSPGGNLHIGGQVTVGPNALLSPYFAFGPENGVPWPIFTLDKGVTVENQGGFFIQAGSTISGPLTATNPSAINLVGATLSGPVNLQGGGSPNGVLDSLGAPPGAYTWSVLQYNTITGPVMIRGYAGITVIVEGNTITRGLTVTGNTQLIGNSDPARGPLFSPNTFFVQGNAIGGSANCSNNGTAALPATLRQDWPQGNTGPNAVSGPRDTCEVS